MAVVLLACGGGAGAEEQDVERLLDAGKYDSARVALNGILRSGPADADALELQVLLCSVERRLPGAADALRKLFSQGVTPDTALLKAALIGALKNGDGGTVVYGIRACGDLSLLTAESLVESAVADRDDDVRQAVYYVIPRYHPDGRTSLLDAAVFDHDPMVRAEVLRSFVRINPGWARDVTQSVVHMQNSEYVLWNYTLLCAAEGDASSLARIRSELYGHSDVRCTEAAAVLVRLGDRGLLRTVAAGLRSRDEPARVSAARSLGDLRATDYLDQLVLAASDASCPVREAVAYALGEIGNRYSVPAVRILLQDKAWQVRATAIVALCRLDSPEAEQAAVIALGDSSPAVRASAIAVLLALRTRRP